MSGPDLSAFLEQSRRRVEAELDRLLPPADEPPALLHAAMRYAILSGGKRLRPALAFAAARACDADPGRVEPLAAAVELVHGYSLVHDDLPCMDDDAERRGQPTVHVKFGEATAVLAGDALLALAFEGLARAGAPAPVLARLGRAAGSRALVGGQADDLAFDPATASERSLVAIHARKTAALFGFAVWGAARWLAAPDTRLARFERFALHYGHAFQLVDDLLDAGRSECSALVVLSPREVEERARAHAAAAAAAVAPLGPAAALLRAMAEDLPARLT